MTPEQVAKETGYTVEEVKQGYGVFSVAGGCYEVIQRIGVLDQYGYGKFKNSTEAGEQALKDGYNVKLETEDEDLKGWYVLQ